MILKDSIRRHFENVAPKYIDWDFYKNYIDVEPPFGQLGLPVFLRTYSRHIPSEKRREKWIETVLRNVEFSIGLDNVTPYVELKKEAEELFDYIFNLRTFPSGRALWTAGSSQTEADPSSIWNCTFRTIDSISSYGEIFYWLLIGAGCGYSVEKEYITQLPSFNNTNKTIKHVNTDHKDWVYGKDYTTVIFNDTYKENLEDRVYLVGEEVVYNELIFDYNEHIKNVVIIVGDSKEGWVVAQRLYLFLLKLDNKLIITFDYSRVRPAGVPLKRFGGVATGCKNFVRMIDQINFILKNHKGKINSEQAMDMVGITALCVVSGNIRRCLPKDTLVHLKDGLKPIQDVQIGDVVKTANGYHKVIEWMDQGVQELITITTQLGEFKCTPNHRVAVFDTPETYIFKQADELNINDRLVFVNDLSEGKPTNLPSFSYVKPAHSTTCTDIVIPELDDDIAYLFGYLHGNGYVLLDGSVGRIDLVVPANQPNTKDKIINIVKKFGVNVTLVEPFENDASYKVRVTSKQLALYLSQYKQPNTTIKIPNFILDGTSNIRVSYLAGLMEADGYFNGRPLQVISTVYYDFAKQVQALMGSLGLPTYIKLNREKDGNWKALYHVNIKGRNIVNNFELLFADKIERYEIKSKLRTGHGYGFPAQMIIDKGGYGRNWCKTNEQMIYEKYEEVYSVKLNKLPIKVLKTEYKGDYAQTYDISVENVEEFVCDAGYLVHNSATIALGDADDNTFKMVKYNLWSDTAKEPYRAFRVMSNNSVVVDEKLELHELIEVFEKIKSNGEPGLYIRANARKYDEGIIGTNPCVETGLLNQQSCNLTTNNVLSFVSYDDNGESYLDETGWRKSLYLSTRIGSRVTTLPQWHPEWDKVQKSQRLLGVSMTGLLDAADALGWNDQQMEDFFHRSRLYVREVADEYHTKLGIERSARVSCVKPEGSLSQLPTVSSGVHRGYAPQYIRRVRFSSVDPLAKALLNIFGKDKVFPENGQGDNLYDDGVDTWVFSFPIRTQAKIRAIDESAISQLERYKLAQTSYTADGHNTSVTVTVAENEWDDVVNWVYENWDCIIGVSFLPKFDPEKETYPQMPYEPCSEEVYQELKEITPIFTENELITLIAKYEDKYDEYEILEDACASGACPLR